MGFNKHRITKQSIWNACQEQIQTRIATAKEALEAARDASQDDTKSSAGDKYETGREMMRQEIERHERLLVEAQTMQHALANISLDAIKSTASVGAVVETKYGTFFIGPGIGKLSTAYGNVFAISPSSPLGKLILGRKQGDVVILNEREYLIQQIY